MSMFKPHTVITDPVHCAPIIFKLFPIMYPYTLVPNPSSLHQNSLLRNWLMLYSYTLVPTLSSLPQNSLLLNWSMLYSYSLVPNLSSLL